MKNKFTKTYERLINENKKLRKEIKELKIENKKLDDSNDDLFSSKYQLTSFIDKKFDWFLDLLQNNQQPNLVYLIKECKRILTQVK